SLRDKVVFVTGGATGIGSEFVTAFARQGAKVGFNDINAEAAPKLIDSLAGAAHRPLFVRCDVTDVAALQGSIGEVAAHFGDVEVLVNNVANDERHDFTAIDAAYFDWMASINLRPHFFAIQAVVPGMKRKGGGSILNVGSISWMRKNSTVAAYALM